jgi:hypothetical protein
LAALTGAILLPTDLRAQAERPTAPQAVDASAILQKLTDLEAGQKRLLERLDRLESRLEQRTEGASDFSHVVIRIRTSDGKPLAGYRATLSIDSDEKRAATASGTSDEEGVAIDRQMPYGIYELALREPTGWYAYVQKVLVEVGQPRDLVFIAPDPSQRGTLVLEPKLAKQAFAGLPFGEVRAQRMGSTLLSLTPEPGQAREAASFPTVEKGIEEIGASLSFSATRELEQPYGSSVTWRWSAPAGASPAERTSQVRFLATSSGLFRWIQAESNAADPVAGAKFFGDLGSDKKLGYLEVEKSQSLQEPRELEVPAGDVEIKLESVFGKASEETLRSLGLKQDDESEFWLRTNLRQDSEWTSRLFDASVWKQSEGTSHVVARTVKVAPGDKETVIVGSP